MPCTLTPDAFECVRETVWSVPEGILTGRAAYNPLGELFMTPQNLHYIFCEYVDRFERETGWVIDADTHRLDAFAALIFDAYMAGRCKYLPKKGMSRFEQAALVQQWNEDTIGAIVFDALKEARKKANYLRRARDPHYGKRGDVAPLHIAKPSVAKMEDAWRFNYAQMGCGRPRKNTMAVPDD